MREPANWSNKYISKKMSLTLMLIFNPYYSGWPLLSIKLTLRSSQTKEEYKSNPHEYRLQDEIVKHIINSSMHRVGPDMCDFEWFIVQARTTAEFSRQELCESAGTIFPQAISRTIFERNTRCTRHDIRRGASRNYSCECIIHWVGTWEFAH